MCECVSPIQTAASPLKDVSVTVVDNEAGSE